MTSVKGRPFHTLLALLALVLPTASFAQTTGRVPVPTKEQQQASAKLLDEGYQVTKATTSTKKQQLVKDLMKVARDTNLKKDDLYVVLTTVISLSQGLRDLPTMTSAVEQLVKSFEVEPLTERTRHLARYLETLNGKSAATLKPVFDEVASLARSAAAEDRYQDAGKLLDEIEAVLTKSQVPANLNQPMTDLRKEITTKKDKFEKLQTSLTVLKSQPDDPDANFTVGLWFMVEETDWNRALPHLAKATKSKPWQEAALMELTPNTEPVKIGDQWWALASSESDPAKRELMRHAGQWYQKALPQLSALEKKLREKRLSEIAALPNDGPKTTRSTKTQTGNASIPADAKSFGGHAYKFFPKPQSWKEAKETCEKLGGYLVTIESADENQFLGKLIDAAEGTESWIGITDEAQEGKWLTVTGKPSPFTNWVHQQPDNKASLEHFGVISNIPVGTRRTGWQWFDLPNRAPSPHSPGFVCEWDTPNPNTLNSKMVDRFRPKSTWISRERGVTVTVAERTPNSFRAVFELINGHKMEMTGTIKDLQISWRFKGATGPDSDGTIGWDEVGDKVDLILRDAKGGGMKIMLRLRN